MSQFLTIPNTADHYATTPVVAAYDPTTTFRVEVRAAVADWSRAADEQNLANQWDTGGTSWIFRLTKTGALELLAAGASKATSSSVVGFGDGVKGWVAVEITTFHASAAVLKFESGTTDTQDPTAVSWTEISEHTGLALTAWTASKPLESGAHNTGSADQMDGDVYVAKVLVDGVSQAHFDADDFTIGDSDTDTAVDVKSRTWTLVGAGVIIAADPTCAVTGTAVAGGVLESEIVTGSETIILTLTGDTWDAAMGTDDASTTALIAGIDSAQSEAAGWDAEVKGNMVFGDITRTSDTVVTINLAAEAAYAITADETITVIVPAAAVADVNQIIASPTFVVTNETPLSGHPHNRTAGIGQVLQTG